MDYLNGFCREDTMSLIDSPQLRQFERFLDLSATRQSLITANIANVDTPGYHARDIDFHGELQRALENDGEPTTAPFVRQVPGLVERPDGNNVSIDRESMLLSEVQMKFHIATQLLRSEFQTWTTAIKEGSNS
jgi:flagellar basal-body rod protein FlgB